MHTWKWWILLLECLFHGLELAPLFYGRLEVLLHKLLRTLCYFAHLHGSMEETEQEQNKEQKKKKKKNTTRTTERGRKKGLQEIGVLGIWFGVKGIISSQCDGCPFSGFTLILEIPFSPFSTCLPPIWWVIGQNYRWIIVDFHHYGELSVGNRPIIWHLLNRQHNTMGKIYSYCFLIIVVNEGSIERGSPRPLLLLSLTQISL